MSLIDRLFSTDFIATWTQVGSLEPRLTSRGYNLGLGGDEKRGNHCKYWEYCNKYTLRGIQSVGQLLCIILVGY